MEIWNIIHDYISHHNFPLVCSSLLRWWKLKLKCIGLQAVEAKNIDQNVYQETYLGIFSLFCRRIILLPVFSFIYMGISTRKWRGDRRCFVTLVFSSLILYGTGFIIIGISVSLVFLSGLGSYFLLYLLFDIYLVIIIYMYVL